MVGCLPPNEWHFLDIFFFLLLLVGRVFTDAPLTYAKAKHVISQRHKSPAGSPVVMEMQIPATPGRMCQGVPKMANWDTALRGSSVEGLCGGSGGANLHNSGSASHRKLLSPISLTDDFIVLVDKYVRVGVLGTAMLVSPPLWPRLMYPNNDW